MSEFDPFGETYEDFLNRHEDSFNSRLGTESDRVNFSKDEEEKLLSNEQMLLIQRLLDALKDSMYRRTYEQINSLKVKIHKLESQLSDVRKILNTPND